MNRAVYKETALLFLLFINDVLFRSCGAFSFGDILYCYKYFIPPGFFKMVLKLWKSFVCIGNPVYQRSKSSGELNIYRKFNSQRLKKLKRSNISIKKEPSSNRQLFSKFKFHSILNL
jgi:hypothetical protein